MNIPALPSGFYADTNIIYATTEVSEVTREVISETVCAVITSTVLRRRSNIYLRGTIYCTADNAGSLLMLFDVPHSLTVQTRGCEQICKGAPVT
jgi:hypothetical protein